MFGFFLCAIFFGFGGFIVFFWFFRVFFVGENFIHYLVGIFTPEKRPMPAFPTQTSPAGVGR